MRGTQEERPARKQAKPLPHEDTAVAVIVRGGRLLLVRRPANARLGGLWAFPWAVRHRGEPVAAAAERAAREGLGLAVRAGDEVGAVDHVFTHVRATYHAVLCDSPAGEPLPTAYDACAWVAPDAVGGYALPIAQQRIAALVRAHLGG